MAIQYREETLTGGAVRCRGFSPDGIEAIIVVPFLGTASKGWRKNVRIWIQETIYAERLEREGKKRTPVS